MPDIREHTDKTVAMSSKLEEQVFNLKFTSKQLQRQAKKSELNAKKEEKKVKVAVENGDMDGARIYAQNAIRLKNERVNFMRLASRIDAAASRVETACRMQAVTKSMASVVKGMDKAMKTMDLMKITQVMDQFDKQFEDVEVGVNYMDESMSRGTVLSTPQDEVDSLIQSVAEEHGLELEHAMGDVPRSEPAAAAAEQDELAERLNRLRAKAT